MAPHNLDIKFGYELDLNMYNPKQQRDSLKAIFDRDMVDNPCLEFNGKKITYIESNNSDERAFEHLITKKVDGSRGDVDMDRARRLHWVKRFLEKGLVQQKYLVFSFKHPNHEKIRTFIYHKKLRHVVILECVPENETYFLVTSYKVHNDRNGSNSILKQYENRLSKLH